MKFIRPLSLNDIESALEKLGRGNHRDNIESLSKFSEYHRTSIDQSDFGSLIFLQTDATVPICPRHENRDLRGVTSRAEKLLEMNKGHLGTNWNLDNILKKSREMFRLHGHAAFNDLTITLSSHGWYLQDGNHRALGYSLLVSKGEAPFIPIEVFTAK